MYLLLNMVIFHCHVSLPGGKHWIVPIEKGSEHRFFFRIPSNSDTSSHRKHPCFWNKQINRNQRSVQPFQLMLQKIRDKKNTQKHPKTSGQITWTKGSHWRGFFRINHIFGAEICPANLPHLSQPRLPFLSFLRRKARVSFVSNFSSGRGTNNKGLRGGTFEHVMFIYRPDVAMWSGEGV